MTAINFSRRVTPKAIAADIDSWHGSTTITKYLPTRSEATPEALKAGALSVWGIGCVGK